MAKDVDSVIRNGDIPYEEIRLNGENGVTYGIVSLEDALRMAEDEGKDVILITDRATPPVCKLIEFGKFKYEKLKQEKEAKRKQTTVELKEIRFSPNIDTNDMNVKKTNIKKLLQKGSHVKVTMRFSGRECSRIMDYIPDMEDLAEELSDVAVVLKPIKAERNNISMVLGQA